ncbi:MAG: 3'-5' exonuclease, partial [Nitrospirae bacterium]|nr:3'-5' exonuclease [Nitrospirota bacterium]
KLINPGIPIPYYPTKITGIDDSMVKNAPFFSDIAEELTDFIGDHHLVGHNIKTFDFKFLEKELDMSLNNQIVDTLPMSRKTFPELKNHKLSTLMENLNIKTSSHRALGDAINAGILYILIMIRKEEIKMANK